MSVDWKSRLIEAAVSRPQATQVGRGGERALSAAVESALQSGVALSDVKQFAAQEPALREVVSLFADGFFDDSARKAAGTVVGISERRSSDRTGDQGGNTSPGLKALSLRADPTRSLPWFKQAALPLMPPSSLSGGALATGQAVIVDGVPFSAADVASLLKLAA
jgi:hypothetical protein